MSLAWIPLGTKFEFDDMVFGRDKDLADVDLIVTGPHASAAFPEEMKPYVDESLTQRLQHDFTDISTAPVCRRWAEIDRHVVYVEDPHPRAVRDANRARPENLEPGLREAFRRINTGEERPSLAGVDAIRPVTFGYLPVLVEPETDDGWHELVEAMETAGALGIDAYERTRDDLIEQCLRAKMERLAGLHPMDMSVSEWRSATTLFVLSFHDTMNLTARPDGAICNERKPEDRLPNVVAISNNGDALARPRGGDGELLSNDDALTMDTDVTQALAEAYRWAFDAPGPNDVAFNRPYLGGYETRTVGPWLRERAARAFVEVEGNAVGITLGAFQNEFLREFLLGNEAAEHLMEPGDDWVMPPEVRVQRIAERLRDAHDRYRDWGLALR